MTTLAVRAQEQAIERSIAQLAATADREVGETAREIAAEQVNDRIGGQLSTSKHARWRSSLAQSAQPSSSAQGTGLCRIRHNTPYGTNRQGRRDRRRRASRAAHRPRDRGGRGVVVDRRAARQGKLRAGRADVQR